jgi:hypothetical protein
MQVAMCSTRSYQVLDLVMIHLMCNRVRNISRQKARHQCWRYQLHTCEILEPGKGPGHGYARILLSDNRTLGINRCCLGRSSCWTFCRSHSVDRSSGWYSRWTVTLSKVLQINLKNTNEEQRLGILLLIRSDDV